MNQPPSSPNLAEDLAKVAAIKAEMTELLLELEQSATGQTIEKPGAWRHHPMKWAAIHMLPKNAKKPN